MSQIANKKLSVAIKCKLKPPKNHKISDVVTFQGFPGQVGTLHGSNSNGTEYFLCPKDFMPIFFLNDMKSQMWLNQRQLMQ